MARKKQSLIYTYDAYVRETGYISVQNIYVDVDISISGGRYIVYNIRDRPRTIRLSPEKEIEFIKRRI